MASKYAMLCDSYYSHGCNIKLHIVWCGILTWVFLSQLSFLPMQVVKKAVQPALYMSQARKNTMGEGV